MRRPFRAVRDPNLGLVQLIDQRQTPPQLLALLDPLQAAALLLDLQQAQIEHLRARIDAGERLAERAH